jgi:F-box protein, helicase, 18
VNLTYEQMMILAADPVAGHPIKVTAFAGTGKTFTLTEYAKSRPQLPMMYVAYNKSIQLHAEKVMPRNVTARTVHSLAFAKFGRKYKDKLGNLKIGSVMRYLDTRDYKFAMFVTRTLEAFLASAFDEINEDCVPTGAGKLFGRNADQMIVGLAKKVWKGCQDEYERDLVMPHDGYLKLYQLSRPQIRTEVVLMDEAQDTTPCVWDIIMKQKAPKIIVGDPHQAIYQFRGARNAMDMVQPDPERDLPLTQSFRFGQELADEATLLLRNLKQEQRALRGSRILDTRLVVEDDTLTRKGTLLLCRGNSMIFDEAYEASLKGSVGFIGGSAGYRLDLYLDGMELKLGDRNAIRNPLLKVFPTFSEFAEFAEVTEDIELRAVVQAVDKYGLEIEERVDHIRAAETDPARADFAFSTVHKSKGLEWPTVVLGMDLARVIQAHLDNPDDYQYPDEEANLLYVALTRGQQAVIVPRKVYEFIRSGRTPPKKKKAVDQDPLVVIRKLTERGSERGRAMHAEDAVAEALGLDSEYDLADYD